MYEQNQGLKIFSMVEEGRKSNDLTCWLEGAVNEKKKKKMK